MHVPNPPRQGRTPRKLHLFHWITPSPKRLWTPGRGPGMVVMKTGWVLSKFPSHCRQGVLAPLMILLPVHLPTLTSTPASGGSCQGTSGPKRGSSPGLVCPNHINRLRNTVSLKEKWETQQQGAHTPRRQQSLKGCRAWTCRGPHLSLLQPCPLTCVCFPSGP